jgi:hypothetical protein
MIDGGENLARQKGGRCTPRSVAPLLKTETSDMCPQTQRENKEKKKREEKKEKKKKTRTVTSSQM